MIQRNSSESWVKLSWIKHFSKDDSNIAKYTLFRYSLLHLNFTIPWPLPTLSLHEFLPLSKNSTHRILQPCIQLFDYSTFSFYTKYQINHFFYNSNEFPANSWLPTKLVYRFLPHSRHHIAWISYFILFVTFVICFWFKTLNCFY